MSRIMDLTLGLVDLGLRVAASPPSPGRSSLPAHVTAHGGGPRPTVCRMGAANPGSLTGLLVGLEIFFLFFTD